MTRLLAALLLCLAGAAAAQDAPLAATPTVEAFAPATASAQAATARPPLPPPDRPLLSSTLRLAGHYAVSPLDLEARDLLWLVPAGVGLGVILNNDCAIYHGIHSDRSAWRDQAMPWISFAGEGIVEAPVVAAAALVGDHRLSCTSMAALQGLAVSGVYAYALKTAAWSNRPSQDDKTHRFWAFDQPSTGFPSGHSFTAYCLAEVYGAEYGRWFTYPLAALVVYSRVYNAAHWPSDVYAGSLLGIAAGWQARKAAEREGAAQWRWGMLPTDDGAVVMASATF